jgi:hypothetical protein
MDQDTTTREEEEEEVRRGLLTRSIKGRWLIEEWVGATQQFQHLLLLSGCHLRH